MYVYVHVYHVIEWLFAKGVPHLSCHACVDKFKASMVLIRKSGPIKQQ